MPTYSYECKKCGHVQDIFHAMTLTPRIRCEKCNALCNRLLGTGAGIIFKGSGFYETDYKKKQGARKDTAKTAGDGGGKSTETKTGDATAKSAPKAKAPAGD